MPTITGATADPLLWLDRNWLWLGVVAFGLFVVWRFARPAIHRIVLGALRAHGAVLDGTSAPEDELRKRAATLEQLLASMVRIGVVAALVVIVLGMFDLWPAIAGLGLLVAAITVAGQSIVLDYLMGILILVEGQYSTGDTISTAGLEGQVEEVGLRRTVIRDPSGTVHSISNGEIRIASNLTRIYASAVVDVPGISERDVEAAIAVMDRVGAGLAADPDWSARILEPPHYVSTMAFTDLGVTLRMSGRVTASARWAVPAELRRRLAPALREAGIEPNRRAMPGRPPG
jgi:moderate conductance mechanosensitive channel